MYKLIIGYLIGIIIAVNFNVDIYLILMMLLMSFIVSFIFFKYRITHTIEGLIIKDKNNVMSFIKTLIIPIIFFAIILIISILSIAGIVYLIALFGS